MMIYKSNPRIRPFVDKMIVDLNDKEKKLFYNWFQAIDLDDKQIRVWEGLEVFLIKYVRLVVRLTTHYRDFMEASKLEGHSQNEIYINFMRSFFLDENKRKLKFFKWLKDFGEKIDPIAVLRTIELSKLENFYNNSYFELVLHSVRLTKIHRIKDVKERLAYAQDISVKNLSEENVSIIESFMKFNVEYLYKDIILSLKPLNSRDSFLGKSEKTFVNLMKEISLRYRKKDELSWGKRLVDCGDDWFWEKLDKSRCELEGEALNHCGTSENRDAKLVSLRRKVVVNGDELYEVVLTGTKLGVVLSELRGRGNTKPSNKYHSQIVKLLMSDEIMLLSRPEYAPEDNFEVEDLSEKDRGILKKARPYFNDLGAVVGQLVENRGGKKKAIEIVLSCFHVSDRELLENYDGGQYFDVTKLFGSELDLYPERLVYSLAKIKSDTNDDHYYSNDIHFLNNNSKWHNDDFFDYESNCFFSMSFTDTVWEMIKEKNSEGVSRQDEFNMIVNSLIDKGVVHVEGEIFQDEDSYTEYLDQAITDYAVYCAEYLRSSIYQEIIDSLPDFFRYSENKVKLDVKKLCLSFKNLLEEFEGEVYDFSYIDIEFIEFLLLPVSLDYDSGELFDIDYSDRKKVKEFMQEFDYIN